MEFIIFIFLIIVSFIIVQTIAQKAQAKKRIQEKIEEELIKRAEIEALEEARKKAKEEAKAEAEEEAKRKAEQEAKLKSLLSKKKSKENMIGYNTTSIKNYQKSIYKWTKKQNTNLTFLIEEHKNYIKQREIIIKRLREEIQEIDNQIKLIQNPVNTENETIKEKEKYYIPKVETIEEESQKEESEQETEKVTEDFIDLDSLDLADENLDKTEEERQKAEEERIKIEQGARRKAEKESKRIAIIEKAILKEKQKELKTKLLNYAINRYNSRKEKLNELWHKLEYCQKRILHKQEQKFNKLKEKAREINYQKFANTTIKNPIINNKKDYLNANPYYIEALNIEEFKIENLIDNNTDLEYFAIPSHNVKYQNESNKNYKKGLSATQKQKNNKIIEWIKKEEKDIINKAKRKAEQEAKRKAEQEARLKAEQEARLKAEQEANLLKFTLTKEKLKQIYELEYIKADNNIKITSITIPKSYAYNGNIYEITKIGNYAFSKHKDLQSIILPDSIHYIGEFAFSDCISLKTFNIPENVKIIETGTFYNCKYLANIDIPDNIIEIKEKAFTCCNSLKNITIPKSVKNIGNKAFAFCISLKEVIIQNSKNNIFISNNAFDKDVKIIFTEDETIQEEKTLNYNKEISNYKEIGDIKFIGDNEEDYIPKVEVIEEEPQKELKAEQEEVATKEDRKQVEENINYIYPILKPLKEFSNKPIDLYSVQKAKIKAIKRGEKIENISLFDMLGKVQEKVKV